jgi:hypothetical protein
MSVPGAARVFLGGGHTDAPGINKAYWRGIATAAVLEKIGCVHLELGSASRGAGNRPRGVSMPLPSPVACAARPG